MLEPTPTPTPVRRLPTAPALGRRLDGLLRRAVPLLLRGSLGVTFAWFGALKLAATAALALHSLGPRPDATTDHRLPAVRDPAHPSALVQRSFP